MTGRDAHTLGETTNTLACTWYETQAPFERVELMDAMRKHSNGTSNTVCRAVTQKAALIY